MTLVTIKKNIIPIHIDNLDDDDEDNEYADGSGSGEFDVNEKGNSFTKEERLIRDPPSTTG